MGYFEKYDNFALVPAEELIKISEARAQVYAKSIKTNQVRNFFSHIQTIKNDFTKKKHSDVGSLDELDKSLILIKPKLAYAVGRAGNKEKIDYKDFQALINESIDKTIKTNQEKKQEAYVNFFAFIEAIIAYHKYYGGKDK